MKAHFFVYLDKLRAAYWFIPTVMSLLAITLSFVTTSADAWLGASWLEDVSWIYANKPVGARVVLSTIAGSMITVAGVVFSITIAAVSYAAAQYGPRLLTNFMRDRGNQFTLGTFIATFLYCLLVIRTVRSADEMQSISADPSGVTAEFVPNISILTGIGLALCSIAVLIYFVHHVARSIHISHVIADIGMQLRGKIVEQYPLELGDQSALEIANSAAKDKLLANYIDPRAILKTDNYIAIIAKKYGFIQVLDEQTMIKTASKHNLTVELLRQPGDFLQSNSRVMHVWPRDLVSEEVAGILRATIICGETRTPVQDLLFLVDELVEIAARALSPGVNDPFTALNCINWLGAAIGDLGRRELPSSYWKDADGRVRVVVSPTTFEDFLSEAFGKLRPYAARDVNVSLHMLDTVAEVSVPGEYGKERKALQKQVSLLLDACAAQLPDGDLARVKERHREVMDIIAQPDTSPVV
ncbi:MAG: DUF2254 domain-containing protein [Hyphomicrobiaceae bacterium]